MIEFSTNNSMFIFQVEQNTVKNSNCTIRMYDKDYKLIRSKSLSITKLSDFILTEFYKGGEK